jgi:Tfp pilus assembly major pilin PilA
MATRLIELSDGTLLEVTGQPGEAEAISATLAERVSAALADMTPVVKQIGVSIAAAWQELNQDLAVSGAEVKLGLSFTTEGSIYVAKASAGANIEVTFTLTPRV